MMSKISLLEDSDEELSYSFFCNGCGCSHYFRIRYKNFIRNSPNRPKDVPLWEWNGNFEKPTVTPSIDCNRSTPSRRCHSFIKEGKIQYLLDSYHFLKGKTVELEEDD